MDKHIATILAELYELEPELKKHEAQLVGIVQKLLAAKPTITLDAAFVKQLRAQLLAGTASDKVSSDSFNFNFMKKFGYILGGAAIASVLIVPVFLSNGRLPGMSLVSDIGLNTESGITMLGEEAFGALSFNNNAALGSEMARSAMDTSATAPAMMPVAETDAAFGKVRPQSGGGGATASMIVDPGMYVPMKFSYQYVGEVFTFNEDKLEVLRKKISKPSVGGLGNQFGLGLLDLNSLNNLKFENVSIVEDKEKGLRIMTDLNSGSVFISNDGGYMPYVEGEWRQLTPQDVPTDEALIAAANGFVNKLGIKLDSYGEPVIQAQQRWFIELARTRPDYYVPDIMNVVYPLQINGTPVYDQGGNEQGISVSVNIRNMQVVSVYGLSVQQYDASLYPIITDVTALVEQYSKQFDFDYGSEVQNVVVELGAPKVVFTPVSTYENNRFSEYLVPALYFPVINSTDSNPAIPRSVVIPIVEAFGQQGGGMRIMPMEAGGSAGSTGVISSPPVNVAPDSPVSN